MCHAPILSVKNFIINIRSTGLLSIVSIASVIYLLVLASTIISSFAHIPNWVLWIQGIGSLTVVANFFGYLKFGNIRVSASLLLFCIFAIHMANVHFAGGIETPHYAWILVIPLIAGATLGWRGQLAFGALTIAGTIAYAIYPVATPNSIYSDGVTYILLSRLLSIIIFTLIMFSYHFALKEKIEQLQLALKRNSFQSELFLGVFNSKVQGVILFDAHGHIVKANKCAHDTFGFSENSLLNDELSNLCQPNIVTVIADKVNQGVSECELQVTTWDNRKLWIEAAWVEVKDQYSQHFTLLNIDDISSRKHHESQLSFLAHYDNLTQLPNRLFVQNLLGDLITKGERYDRQFAVVFIDLDKFKNINDMQGHEAGDIVLSEVAKRLQRSVRRCDTVARFGGDEFVLVLDEVSSSEQAYNLLNKLQNAIKQPITINNKEYLVDSSCGVSLYPNDGLTTSELLRKADTAMYKAKSQSKGAVEFYNQQHDNIVKRQIKLGNDLHFAIEKDELILLFQPIYDIHNTLCGAEALLRWQHGELGSITPDEFIPISEENGLIAPIGLWVIESALAALRKWHDMGAQHLTMSINLSYQQMNESDLITKLKQLLMRYNIEGKYITLELTERVFAEDLALVKSNIQAFSNLGIKTAIDDFGVGYSSLSYLRRTPFSSLKIDRSFVRDMEHNESAKSLCKAIVCMAKSLNLKITAEGVENQQQLTLLKQMNINCFQGFYLSKPINSSELESLLNSNERRQSLAD